MMRSTPTALPEPSAAVGGHGVCRWLGNLSSGCTDNRSDGGGDGGVTSGVGFDRLGDGDAHGSFLVGTCIDLSWDLGYGR